MKYSVTKFKSLEIALKEMEPLVRDGNYLLTGKPFKKLGGMLPREILGNWLVCAVVNANEAEKICTFTSDPQSGDGVIFNVHTNEGWFTEHVMVARPHKAYEFKLSIEDRIIEAYSGKVKKGGYAYARGKTLIIFLDVNTGKWQPRKLARQLPSDLVFSDVWVFGLLPFNDGKYVYGISQLGDIERQAPTWIVQIDDQFSSWNVEILQ
jgi:hypothetical protein